MRIRGLIAFASTLAAAATLAVSALALGPAPTMPACNPAAQSCSATPVEQVQACVTSSSCKAPNICVSCGGRDGGWCKPEGSFCCHGSVVCMKNQTCELSPQGGYCKNKR